MADIADTHERAVHAEAAPGGYGAHGTPGFFTRWFLSTNHNDIEPVHAALNRGGRPRSQAAKRQTIKKSD